MKRLLLLAAAIAVAVAIGGFTIGGDKAHASPTLTKTVTVTIGSPTQEFGWGTGDVLNSPVGSGIDCGTICSAQYGIGSIVTLIAYPDAGSRFGHWDTSGVCAGQGQTCKFTVPAAGNPGATVWFDCWLRVGHTCSPADDSVGDSAWLYGQGLLIHGGYGENQENTGDQPDTFIYACGDGDDDDGDGLTDLADPGCQNTQDDDEWNAPPPAPPAPPQPPPPPPPPGAPPPPCGAEGDECDLVVNDEIGTVPGGKPAAGHNCNTYTSIKWDRPRRPTRAVKGGIKVTNCADPNTLTVATSVCLQKAHQTSQGHGAWQNGLCTFDFHISLEPWPYKHYISEPCLDTQTRYIWRVEIFWLIEYDNRPEEQGTLYYPRVGDPRWPNPLGARNCR